VLPFASDHEPSTTCSCQANIIFLKSLYFSFLLICLAEPQSCEHQILLCLSASMVFVSGIMSSDWLKADSVGPSPYTPPYNEGLYHTDTP
jgi:hypothetical protein